MSVTYICENGHENQKHKSQPDGHSQKPVCVDCGADIIERRVPMYDCADCGYRWFYKGDAASPTCPECKGKRTELVKLK